ncbi:hypothetical protein [Gloeocapsopsis dulcis]|uniref:Uncharacterized protein n=1 Tax=Gloeocapsopsis dulcis AAB1 = 1H9 TaxID=1433147 RepID=A0A6N8FXI7_9CHRO|nr:hypothetical protein [Gloeocapsopsis dulcis]MUL36857.1 hypothetical protein [Gloeocapsopsis dulcis AAB1 = 1H9]WNN88535.1 hypothetical protein P0S91_19945 [Gloeocapsopsis dulcis]
MNQEFIHDFLKIPGVLGVALIKGQALPYFYIKQQNLEWHKKYTLTQSIRENITKIPEGAELFDFQVMGYYAYSYKLNDNLRFLVLTNADIAANKLRELAAKQLKSELQKNIDDTITTFKLLTEIIPQPKGVVTTGTTESYVTGNSSHVASEEVNSTIEELLKALNCLSKFSSNYMGSKLIANYWQLTRPNVEWLDKFQINRSAEITFSGISTETVSALQHRWIKEWAAAFIKQCSQIIQDLPNMIEQDGLDESNRRLLLTPTLIR